MEITLTMVYMGLHENFDNIPPRDVVAGQRVVRTHRHAILIQQASAGRSIQATRWRILKILFVSKRKGVLHGNDTVRRALEGTAQTQVMNDGNHKIKQQALSYLDGPIGF